jgi:hypothetical protein
MMKAQGMTLNQAVFLRIDTMNGTPYLEGSAGEAVVKSLFTACREGWYQLLGFVVLPCELLLLIVPYSKGMNEILGFLEAEVLPQVSADKLTNGKVFDTDYYREKVDSNDEIQMRLRWMHSAPIRCKLTVSSGNYPYSSANARFRDQLPLTGLLN